jgi:sec-independent protein translocase protein TatA
MFEGLLQPTHLIIILVIILIVFGAGKLPEVGGGLGRSITEFRKGVHETSSDDEPVDRAPVATPVQATGSVCSVCGASLPPGAKFCASCGTKQAA